MRMSDVLNESEFKTGKAVSFYYMRNTEKAPYFPDNLYGQDLEPAGEYVTYYDPSWNAIERNKENGITNWIFGKIAFKNPLVIRDNISTGATGWKKDLSDAYKGLTGKRLSRVLIKAGYDGIVVYDEKYGSPSEIVNLNGTKSDYDLPIEGE